MSNLKRVTGNRIVELCKQQDISINTLSVRAGIASSNIRNILDRNKKTIGLKTIKIICDEFGITLGQFFTTPEFDELEQELE
jgi:transcriptional regulator with XRE-family HTH domain